MEFDVLLLIEALHDQAKAKHRTTYKIEKLIRKLALTININTNKSFTTFQMKN